MEKYYKVSESELRELIYDSMTFSALQNGGVDNWEWYSTSIQDFIEANGKPNDSIYDIAENELKNYEEVE